MWMPEGGIERWPPIRLSPATCRKFKEKCQSIFFLPASPTSKTIKKLLKSVENVPFSSRNWQKIQRKVKKCPIHQGVPKCQKVVRITLPLDIYWSYIYATHFCKKNDFWGIFLAWPPFSSFWPFKRVKRLQNASLDTIFKNWLDTRPKMLNA